VLTLQVRLIWDGPAPYGNAAALRLPRLLDRETVPGMAGGARAFRSVGIDPPDSGVRPRRRCSFPFSITLTTLPWQPAHPSDNLRSFDDVPEEVVERTGELRRLRMVRLAELLGLLVMTPHTVLRVTSVEIRKPS